MKTDNKHNHHTSPGFTLVEVIVATALILVLAVGVAGIQRIAGENQIVLLQSYLNTEDANTILSQIIRNIRNARPSDNGSYSIVQASPQELILYSDIDIDGTTERIRYFLTGTTLSRGVIEPVGTPATYPTQNEKITILSTRIQNSSIPVFTYYNGDWPSDIVHNPLTSPVNISSIQLVKVYIKVSGDNEQIYTLENEAQIRMEKTNL